MTIEERKAARAKAAESGYWRLTHPYEIRNPEHMTAYASCLRSLAGGRSQYRIVRTVDGCAECLEVWRKGGIPPTPDEDEQEDTADASATND